MTVVAGKKILVVGNETAQIHALEDELIRQGASIVRAQCGVTPVSDLAINSIDAIFLNHVHTGSTCVGFLSDLQDSRIAQAVPILALVENSQSKIEEALALGAADYFTADEKLQEVLSKVYLLFGEPDTISQSVIDIDDKLFVSTREGIRVYVVEDDPLLGNLLTMRLEQAKFTFIVDASGENAVKKLQKFKPNVLVLDLMLPGRNGFDILREVRNDKELNALPVIIFSNRDSAEDKETARELGANAFFVKAMTDLSELVDAIERLV